MSKARPYGDYSNPGSMTGCLILCPACNEFHGLDERFTWNGDTEKPSFTPSLVVRDAKLKTVCHSIITAGEIHYQPDCTHPFAGQTFVLLDVFDGAGSVSWRVD